MITNTITLPPSFPPQHTMWAPSPSPSPAAAVVSVIPITTAPPLQPPQQQQQQQEEQTINFSPPLIAMVVVIAAAFFIITYSRLITRHLLLIRRRISRWRNHRRRRRHSFLPSSSGDDDNDGNSPYATTTDGYHPYSPYGLDESFIKNIPLTLYNTTKNDTVCDCAVCLIEFEHGNYIRTLPVCSHAFHVDCIDMWLRSHANCPLCRSHVVVKQESPFVPMMCSRIRPSLDEYDVVLEAASASASAASSEITQLGEAAEEQQSPSMRQPNGLLLLKRSYSFGFERNLGSERMVSEPTTSSPWRYNRRSFWSKRTSPFMLLGKPRVFSFRGMKSPFFRRRGFFPMSEGGGGVMSSRRRRNYTAAGFSSSRLRCGDPEALLSPERFNRR